jgi:hypothetical protein
LWLAGTLREDHSLAFPSQLNGTGVRTNPRARTVHDVTRYTIAIRERPGFVSVYRIEVTERHHFEPQAPREWKGVKSSWSS